MSSLARSIALSLLLAASGTQAAPWTYRGTLSDGGAPANGRYDIRLSVLDAAGAKALVYPLTFSGVEVKDGAFAVDVDFGVDLGQLGAVKLKTEVAQGGSGFVALGEPQSFDAKAALVGVCWDTTGNTGNVAETNFVGNVDAGPLDLRSSNVRVARFWKPASLVTNVVLGSSANSVLDNAFGATVGGGGQDESGGSGVPNVVSDNYGTVSGGIDNHAGDQNGVASNASYATVSGGTLNRALARGATVGGGYNNLASGSDLGYATVSGGVNNDAQGDYAVVPGGSNSDAKGDFSLAAGRRAKVRGPIDTGEPVGTCGPNDFCGDEGTFVWADSQNSDFTSSGPNQFLVRADGGVGINGTPATTGLEMNIFGATPFDGFVEFGLIPKPSLNGNTGERIEFGVGKGGAGTNDADLRIVHRNDSSGSANFFEHLSIDGDGSVIVRSNPNNTAQGVQLAIGAGAWSSLSDLNLKTDIQSIEPLQLLERLVAMPIQQWRYIGQPGEVQHIGPMAQDFAAAFGVGENDTTISTVDADGVALAAIQGRNQKLETELAQSRAENAGLQSQLQQLAARLAALEAAGER